ncbi:MAG: hypothetical protein AUH95_01760 [Nitrospirae bacterium 13_2_20CM_2_63_8]|nr:MAG: hypothetical protein AUH95_01760 [Nitrospirae bacterium 13_2_20CM_2_63_8]
MNRGTQSASGVGVDVIAGLVVLLVGVVLGLPGEGQARELLAPKEQAITEVDPTKTPSLDQQKQGVPQSIFVWIKMARGYEVEWDTFGRKGWYTQDPRLKPIDPGTTVFAPDTPAVYIVFEVAPLEDPAQFSAQWYLEDEKGNVNDKPLGQDTLAVPGHERYGFLELTKPPGDWTKGSYLVQIYVTPQGQQAFHAVNQVGTMRFKIADQISPTGASATGASASQ